MLKKANEFISRKAEIKNLKYYPKYHFAPQTGWMNDPNGIVYYQNHYHLFYQYYPYDTIWGPMHWGHARSKDGIEWEHLGVALAPDKNYDLDGCFSGSALEKDGELYLMYTGHIIREDGSIREVQNIAISSDGENFLKYSENPVIGSFDLPVGTSKADFRDPKLFERNGHYYCVIGSRTDDFLGQVLLYESEDLLNWNFVSVVYEHSPYLGTMVECPDILFFEDKVVFILSSMNYKDCETGQIIPHKTFLIEGKMDWEKYVFNQSRVKELDGGIDYYAPQTTILNEGEYFLLAWLQGWERTFPTHDLNHGWNGQMSLPRIITYDDGDLRQKPISTIYERIKMILAEDTLTIGTKVDLFFDEYQYLSFDGIEGRSDFEIELSNEVKEKIVIQVKGSKVQLNRKLSGNVIVSDAGVDLSISEVELNDGLKSIEIFIDSSSIECFINQNVVISNRFYSNEKLTKIKLSSSNDISIYGFKVGIFID